MRGRIFGKGHDGLEEEFKLMLDDAGSLVRRRGRRGLGLAARLRYAAIFTCESLDRAAQFLELTAEVGGRRLGLRRRFSALLFQNMDSAHQARQLLAQLARALLH